MATPAVTRVSGTVRPFDRLTPGTEAMVEGLGFASNATVELEGLTQPGVRVAGPGRLRFSVVRPDLTALPRGMSTGEAAMLVVVNPGRHGGSSSPHRVILQPYRILVLGDSVAWGQGLAEADKFTTLVAARVLGQNARNARQQVYLTMLAHSGATIGVGDAGSGPFGGPIEGEVPVSHPTVLQQASNYAANAANEPSLVRLVVITAGLNDINFRRILNPFTPMASIASLIDAHCYGSVRALLATVSESYSRAAIVICGYYPTIGPGTQTNAVQLVLNALGVNVAVPDPLKSEVVARSRLFHRRSTAAIRAAVDSANEDLPLRRVVFADPSFIDSNAVMAEDPWLLGFTASGGLEGDAGVNAARASFCAARYPQLQDALERGTCTVASIGHPNVTGASHYADAIIEALRKGAKRDELASVPKIPATVRFGVGTAGHQVEGNPPANDWTYALSSSTYVDRVKKTLAVARADPHATFVPVGDGVVHRNPAVLRADLARAVSLGVRTYRLSFEWSRLQPSAAASNQLDPGAIAFYRAVIDEVRNAGLSPIVTMNHLTLPLWVLTPPTASTYFAVSGVLGVPSAVETQAFRNSLRGWESRATVDAFIRYVRLVVQEFMDIVDEWITVNEPVGSIVGAGYFAGVWPPGFLLDESRALSACRNLIRAHVLAYDAIKGSQPASRVGFAHNMMHVKRTGHAGVLDNDRARDQLDYFYNTHWLEATLRGRVDTAFTYEPGKQQIADEDEFFGSGLNGSISWPRADFIGVNYYRSVYAYADEIVNLFIPRAGGGFVNYLEGSDEPHYGINELGWEISPVGLRELTDRLAPYGLPILITENGLPEPRDANRAPFIVAHVAELAAAIQSGVDVEGYLHWTLVDNFEWLDGYSIAFGLYGVDRGPAGINGSGQRTMTEGALAFSHVANTLDIRSSARLFGNYDKDGYAVRAPRRSIYHLSAQIVNGPAFELTLGSAPGFWRVGAVDDWHQLAAATFDRATSELTIEMFLGGTWRQLSAVRNGAIFQGNTDDGTPWSATIDPLVGTWASSSLAVSELVFLHLGQARTFKVLPGSVPPTWRPGDSMTFDGSTLTWVVQIAGAAVHFVGAVTADSMSGTLESSGLVGHTVAPWSANRRPWALED
jgi:beta-glucosidase/6-phospho-beta-glucosidase/beta-galactosidase/lysophospholipase L1-like esterase